MVIERKKLGLKFIEVILDNSRALEIAAQKNNYDYINIISYDQLPISDDFYLLKKQSARISLIGGLDSVMDTFDSTTKKHIKRTFKINNLSFKIPDDDFAKTYSAYREFERANRRKPFSRSVLKNLWIFNAYNKQDIISSILCYQTDFSLKAHTIFSKRLVTADKEKYKLIAYTTRRLIYEICRFASNHNYSFVDLGSLNFTNPEKSGITNFKLTFNPIVADEYHYIYRSKLFLLIKKLLRLLG